jgi:hypothetical protein
MNIARASLTFLLLLASTATPTRLPAQNRASDVDNETAVIAAVTRLAHAQTGYDAQALEHLLAPGYLEISPLGQVDKRSDVIGFHGKEAAAKASAAGISQTADLDGITTDIIGDAAIVAAKESVAMTMRGSRRTTCFRVSYFLRKSRSGWQVKRAQYTPIRDRGMK